MSIPDLVFEYPDCSVCDDGGSMSFDGDSFSCEDCGRSWDRDGRNGELDGVRVVDHRTQ
jgi:tRNA(Ile2) C34 agmatinyltransferase TiaS